MPKRQRWSSDGDTVYEARVLDAAEALCRQRLTSTPNDSRLLYVAGRLAAYAALDDSACAYLRLAIALAPRPESRYYVALGDVLVRQSSGEAVAAYLSAVTLARLSSVPYARLGQALVKAGRLSEAIAAYQEAARLQPRDAAMRRALGSVHYLLGHVDSAIQCFEESVTCDPCDFTGYVHLGRARLTKGDWTRALAAFRYGSKLADANALLGSDMSQRVLQVSSMDDVSEILRSALTSNPTDVGALSQLVEVLEALKRLSEATEIRVFLAAALEQQIRYREALCEYCRALVDRPGSLRALLGVARVCLAAGEPSKAIPFLRKALVVSPNHDLARAGLGNALHLTGEVQDGWAAFARYYYPQGENARPFEQPVWEGSPLDGKTILLWSNFGRGDVIQFLRYVSFAHSAGGRVIVECHHKGLLPLIGRMAHVDRVVLRGAPLPSFDVHAPLMCFPAIVEASRQSYFSDVPYLAVDPNLAETWRARLKPQTPERTIGLCWGGAVAHAEVASRFLSFDTFSPLAKVSGIRLVSLQHGPQSAELLSAPLGLKVERLFGESFSIVDAAALITNLDLVITVDTMIAHLAGALGKPVWMLLRFASNWRWQIQGSRTPWYPTMRLFRQARANDWLGVVERVRTALEAGE